MMLDPQFISQQAKQEKAKEEHRLKQKHEQELRKMLADKLAEQALKAKADYNKRCRFCMGFYTKANKDYAKLRDVLRKRLEKDFGKAEGFKSAFEAIEDIYLETQQL